VLIHHIIRRIWFACIEFRRCEKYLYKINITIYNEKNGRVLPCQVGRKDHRQPFCILQSPLLTSHHKLCLHYQIRPECSGLCQIVNRKNTKTQRMVWYKKQVLVLHLNYISSCSKIISTLSCACCLTQEHRRTEVLYQITSS
jgi:hypothetical protein